MSNNMNNDEDKKINRLPVKVNTDMIPLYNTDPINEKRNEEGNQSEKSNNGQHPDGGGHDIPPINGPLDGKAVREVFVAASIGVLLALAWVYMPFFALVIPFFFPLAFILLAVRRGFNIGLISLILSMAFMALAANIPVALDLFLQVGLVTICFAYFFRVRKPAGQTLAAGMLVLAFGTILTLIMPVFTSGADFGNIFSYSSQTMSEFFDSWTEAVDITPILPQGMTVAEYKIMFLETISQILPSYYVVFAFFQAFITYLLASAFIKRSGQKVNKLPPFDEWRLHWLPVWGVIIGLALRSLGNHLSLDMIARIGANILYVYYPVLVIFGLAFFIWFLRRWRAGFLLKLVFIVLFFYNLIVSSVSLMLIAAFDPLINFRSKLSYVFKKK